MKTLGGITSTLPPHLQAAQMLIDRVALAEDRKELIVLLGAIVAISRDEAFVLMTANQLETA